MTADFADAPLAGSAGLPAKRRSARPFDAASRLPEFFALLALLFVLQSGLVPFRFGSASGKSNEAFLEVRDPPLPDRVSNIALYVPLAFFGHWVLSRRLGGRAFAAGLAVAAATGLSAAIEAAQHYSPARVSSVLDVICNVTGAAIGVSLSSIAQGLGIRGFGAGLGQIRRRPRAAAIKAYCGLLVVGATLPFTFCFEPARLKRQIESAILVPFAVSTTTDVAAIVGSSVANGFGELEAMKRWSRWAAEAASFLVLAWLLYPFLRRDYGFSGRAAAAMTVYLAGLLAIALSALQLTVISRGLDATDVVFRLAGAMLGAGVGAFAPLWRESPRPAARTLGIRRMILGAGCAATVVYIAYNGLIPFRYEFSGDRLATAVSSDALVPFLGYFKGRADRAMGDLAEKVAAFAILAALWAARRRSSGKTDGGGAWPGIALACAVLSGAIECIQVFNPVRVPGLTDPILAGVGAFVGLFCYQSAIQLVAAVESTPEAETKLELMPALGLTDELIASLAEPEVNAPAELDPLARRLRQSEFPPQ